MLKIGEFSKIAQISVKTLRYYHQFGLLKPAWTDRFNGYRYYSLEQLATLHRIMALKELGFSLEQTQTILREDLSEAELRGMMRLKQAELEQHIQQEQTRLKQIENRLQQIAQEGTLPAYDVVIKQVTPRKVGGIRRTIHAVQQIPELFLALHAALPGASLAADPAMPAVGIFYDGEYSERGIDMEAAAPVSARAKDHHPVVVHQLPGSEQMACVVHKGSLEGLHQAHFALVAWAEANRYRIIGPNREVYLQGFSTLPEDAEPQDLITEVQFPVERKPTPIFIQKHQESKIMEPKIVTKPAFTVVGLPYHGKNEHNEISQLWGKFNESYKKVPNTADPETCYGVCGDIDEEGNFKYLAGLEVSKAGDLPAGMESWEVPQHEYAVFPCSIPTIGETYEFAHNTWLPAAGYTRSAVPDFELYDENFDPNNPESVLYVYIPVERKS